MAESADKPRWRRWLRWLVLLVLALVCARIIVGLVGSIDWGTVREALGHLALWQLPVLVLAVFFRQVFNAAPLAIFIPGLGLPRAVVNDQASILMCTIAPPPSDLVIRVTMFKSWGVEVSRALAGVVMNTVSFYITRWYAPVIGFVLVLYDRFDQTFGWAALVGGLSAAALLVVVRVIASGEQAARWVGSAAGRIVRRVRSAVDPDAWADAVSRFRGHVRSKLRTGLPRSLLALLVMMVCDAFVLVLAIRFVDVSGGALPTVEIVAAYMVTYPLTMFPVFGIGILDAAALAIMVGYAGVSYESYLIAALVVWRIVTIGTPLALGAIALLLWRRMRPVGEALSESG
ncbi:lysylphosphatidylglycerol synthase domain-containing protein [Solicola gregarius]|uniref:Flippase-like domain-containing protein n=1 Tax=Solicola gregarius TaxID=2908642 RepID=A0AA46TL32_9ACTN|nr:lysylphosphatidylglycerol synthase domain-containing protein [Solicola gregarius]UYM07299.1 flippase-like domain-containing protein [Solicola gregarius]